MLHDVVLVWPLSCNIILVPRATRFICAVTSSALRFADHVTKRNGGLWGREWCNIVAPEHAHYFDLLFQSTIQHVATYNNRMAKRTQHVVPNNVALGCVEMLRAFGQLLQNISQHGPCVEILRGNIASFRSGLILKQQI